VWSDFLIESWPGLGDGKETSCLPKEREAKGLVSDMLKKNLRSYGWGDGAVGKTINKSDHKQHCYFDHCCCFVAICM